MFADMGSVLTRCALTDLAVQWLCWAAAAALRTEKFFDLAGSGTFLLLAHLSRLWGGTGYVRQNVQTGLVTAWALRLGTFLFVRILKEGQDRRFNHVRDNPKIFFVYWTMQGFWVFVTLLPTLILNSKRQDEPLGTRDYVGWGIWGVGFATEAIADQQKWNFRQDPDNIGKFIQSGLWAYSQHPNYLGEILQWTGLFISASSVMRGPQYLSVVSPLFLWFLLCHVSGIPILEKQALQKWGSDPAFQNYIKHTPLLWPDLRHSCNPVLLFDVGVEKYCPQNSLPIKRTLEKEARQSQALIIWTDCDREGENIGFEIINVCKAVNSNIQVYRARFSEITPNSVRRACETLGDPNIDISDAVEVRQELDLRIGAAFTRFQTLRLQKIFPNSLANHLISYGSCQFPTLGFVVERFKAIQAFIPETFFKIKVTHEVEGEEVEFSWKRHRLFSHTACLVLYQICMEDPTATVVSVTSKPKSKWRPLPLDTVELEKLASRKLKISAKETMKIAEKLYSQGYISYPRTETNMFPQSLNLRSLVELQTQDAEWGAFAQGILDRGGPTPRNGNKSDQAHPPIHPTKYSNCLQGNARRLYEFIVRHFLACCSQDAQGQETTVDIEIAQEKFCAHGLMIIAKNYLEVYPYEKWNAKVIPVYEQGSQFMPTTMMMVEGQTSPPQLLTEADLIALMEKHNIGTDATHAEHIETVKTRLYVGLTPDQRFLPGELGMGLVEGYNSMGYEMSKPDLRAELEADLKLVCEGKKNKAEVLRRHVQKYKAVFIQSMKKAKKLDEALSVYLGEAEEYTGPEEQDMEMVLPVRKCPQCGCDMVLKKKSNGAGMFLGCTGYPSCKSVVWFPDVVLEVSRDESICPTCQPHPVHMLKFKFKEGSLPPMMPLEFVGCIGGCDETLREVLNLTYLRGRQGGGGSDGSATQANSQLSDARPTTSRAHRASQQPTSMLTARWTAPPATTESSDAVVCNCGQEAALLTVRKDGPNRGRQFYKCSARICEFFLWAEQTSEQGGANLNFPLPRAPVGFGPVSSGRGATMCSCNQLAVQRTVAKEGSNKGRMFLTCSKPRKEQCGFFQWVDSPQAPAPDSGRGGTAEAPGADGAGQGSRAEGSKRASNKPSNLPPVIKRRRALNCELCRQSGHRSCDCPQDL